jgi:mannose-1-phosphate guanylyltransferase
MIALFMAGGSGTRLWPLSRESNPKQLHALVGPKSLMTQTVERVAPLIAPNDVWIVTGRNYADQIAAHAPGVPPRQIITEPFALGTNLAVGLGAMRIARHDPEAVILVGWADSHIGREAEFRAALEKAARIAPTLDGVILGVRPTCAATGYGYIEIGAELDDGGDDGGGAFKIARFEEKPSAGRAEEFFRSGRHLWNPGISVWKVSRLLELIEEFTPEHFAALEYAAEGFGRADETRRMEEAFRNSEPIAIDRAIFEKAANLATIPADLEWSDIGAWSALYDVQAKNGGGNVTRGEVVALDTDGCLIYAGQRLVATLGVSDLIIVETGDAILIAHKNETERLKEIHARVRAVGGARYL